MRVKSTFLSLLLVSSSAFAQSLTIGSSYGAMPNTSDLTSAEVRTDVSLQPATANGTISTVHVYWSSTGCTNAIKIKFLHRAGKNLTVFAERGPFTATTNDYTINLSPAVTVQQGDLIGVARVQPCGNAAALAGIVGTGYLQFPSDVTGTLDIGTGMSSGATLFVYGSGNATSSVARIVPVVGSVPGGFGSNFKTQIQLYNPSSAAINGTITFHPANASGQPSDPSTPYAIGIGRTQSYNDIVATMGQTGIGSFDITVPLGQQAPLVVTRIYNDGGSNGTTGFNEELVALDSSDKHVLGQGSTGIMLTPVNPSKTRFNIGVRTLSQGATITFVLKDVVGNVVATVTKDYAPNFFEQNAASAFFKGALIGGDMVVQATVSSGSAVIYGSTTDNTTNDPSIQVMTVLFTIA